MTTRVARLSRLSRNKTTGNFIIGLVVILCSAFILNGLISGFSSTSDNLVVTSGVLFCLFSLYFINKRLRQPFFSEYYRYFDELGERRLKIQKTVVLVDLIEPLQTFSSIKTSLIQLNELHNEMENLGKVTSSELDLRSSAMRTPQIQNTLQAILKFSESTINQIDRKYENMVYLAKVRKIVFNSINQHLNRPRNKIETDFLKYKVEKILINNNQKVEDCLVQQILNHALDQGEISGRLEQDNKGDKLLAVERLLGNREIESTVSSRIDSKRSKRSEVQCIICRHKIYPSEPKTKCSSCGNSFHRTHLLEWLKVFGHCPICHQRISVISNSP